MIQYAMPRFMRHFSVGSTIGITIGLLASLWFDTIIIKWLILIFSVLAVTGFYNIKNDFVEALK